MRGIYIVVALIALVFLASVFFYYGNSDSSYDQNTVIPGSGSGVLDENMEDEMPSDSSGTVLAGTESQKEFTILADDDGFYINGEDVDSISVNLGEEIKITFNVDSDNVYYAGLDFRGCGFDTDNISPGGSVDVEFIVQNTCTITSYWPSSNVVKDRLNVMIS